MDGVEYANVRKVSSKELSKTSEAMFEHCERLRYMHGV